MQGEIINSQEAIIQLSARVYGHFNRPEICTVRDRPKRDVIIFIPVITVDLRSHPGARCSSFREPKNRMTTHFGAVLGFRPSTTQT